MRFRVEYNVCTKYGDGWLKPPPVFPRIMAQNIGVTSAGRVEEEQRTVTNK